VRAVLGGGGGGGGQGDDADDSCSPLLPRIVVVDDVDVLLPSARRSGLPRTLSISTSLRLYTCYVYLDVPLHLYLHLPYPC
jgi:hypothetical protein